MYYRQRPAIEDMLFVRVRNASVCGSSIRQLTRYTPGVALLAAHPGSRLPINPVALFRIFDCTPQPPERQLNARQVLRFLVPISLPETRVRFDVEVFIFNSSLAGWRFLPMPSSPSIPLPLGPYRNPEEEPSSRGEQLSSTTLSAPV